MGRNFSPLNVYSCYSTTMGPIDKWITRLDSAHWIGLVPTLYGVLIVGWWCCTEGWRFNQVWAEFLCHAIFCFGLYLHNHWSYGQTDGTGGFSASNWSKTNPLRFSNCSWKWWYRGVKKAGGIFAPQKSGTFLLVSPQPLILWTNGGHRRIQRIKLV
jgi:hypothetical protein